MGALEGYVLPLTPVILHLSCVTLHDRAGVKLRWHEVEPGSFAKLAGFSSKPK
jgi:hypothetical protein